MTLRVHIVGAIVALLMTSAANAATITNRSDKEVKLTVTENQSRQDHLLQPGKVIEGVCQKGCIIRLNDGKNDEYELDGSETLSVEEGFLYYESTGSGVAPVRGGASSGGSKRSN